MHVHLRGRRHHVDELSKGLPHRVAAAVVALGGARLAGEREGGLAPALLRRGLVQPAAEEAAVGVPNEHEAQRARGREQGLGGHARKVSFSDKNSKNVFQ